MVVLTKNTIPAEVENNKLNKAPPCIPKVNTPENCTLLYLYMSVYPGTTNKAIESPTICALATAVINKEKTFMPRHLLHSERNTPQALFLQSQEPVVTKQHF